MAPRERSVKRTTIILDQDERDYIDSLINQGREPGIKPLVSKMLDVYRSMRIYDWKFPGEYYIGISRVAFINVEFLDVLLKNIPENKWKEVGNEIGKMAKVSLEASMDIETSNKEKWDEVFKRLRVQGFGDFYLKDKFVIIRTPLISNAKFLCGFIESLIGVSLDVRTITPPLVFEIVK
ncbi:MAG: hypothetical protein IAX21_08210 [Candidatus Bathyarchaeota archaeon]|nr:hypothetical protein [Candidatus Bathyarchaeum tardum]WGM89127.1 MAG: hypothetical protein NUK63_09465 [Candidatus Bathyarchaeum tardum]WNZ28633.1 MAG: hypothetical protein IAX21_08210 [Candidatus Bathyarchaeota archaeon]